MTPGEFIKQRLSDKGWNQRDLARILNRPLPNVNMIITGKTAISPETAVQLAEAFGDKPENWLLLDSQYRLSQVDRSDDSVARRAKVFELVPVNELQKRGWIRPTDDIAEIEKDVIGFLEISSVMDEPNALGPMRKSDAATALTPTQRAWCYRVRHLAKLVPAARYDESRLPQCVKAIRKLAAFPQEASKLAEVFGSFGIRFVVVEPLTGSKVDGVALWLDEKSPVIGVSVRYDRIDSFWFTVGHELAHIRHRDTATFDSDLDDGQGIDLKVKSPTERRADSDSAATLIDPDELKSFIRRVGPLYSKAQIIQFAHRIKVHPGVIVGQLQHKGEISYRANREMLPKVRDFVVSTALTDGWGQIVETGVV